MSCNCPNCKSNKYEVIEERIIEKTVTRRTLDGEYKYDETEHQKIEVRFCNECNVLYGYVLEEFGD